MLSFILLFLLSCSSYTTYYSDELKAQIRILDTVYTPSYISRPMRSLLLNYQFKQKLSALDIGSGSGILAYIIASRGFDKIIATDINEKAIKTIDFNSKRLNIKNIKATLVKKNQAIFLNKKYDLIVSNPPWFDQSANSIKESALKDKNLSLLTKILSNIKKHLSENGVAFIELGGPAAIKRFIKDAKLLKLNYEVQYSSKYGPNKKPYRIFKIKNDMR